MVHPPKRLSTFTDVSLYCITTAPDKGQSYAAMVEAACAGGADVIQLREKSMGSRELFNLCRELKVLCDKAGSLFILNDRVDVAVAADLDGVHVGQDDLPVEQVRRILGYRKLIGCSTHSIEQAFQAQTEGADYVSCGPVFATPTKPDYAPVGLGLVKQYRTMLRIPFVAIGGIDTTNLDTVVRAGADRVAVVRAVCGAKDVELSARQFKDKIVQCRRERNREFVRK
ncbi:MAG TPA: thiamine phosphate synthase [Elusimicrobiota bacterium]|nr:thiamine phosphate synthase [Elusimicrobiota bacterium]